MDYTIVAPHPKELREEIIQCIKDERDSNDSAIDTWEVRNIKFKKADGTTYNEDVLVHNAKAWKDIGYIRLKLDLQGNLKLYAQFRYWDKYPEKERDGSHELYLDGRLTELLLVHFVDDIRSIQINK